MFCGLSLLIFFCVVKREGLGHSLDVLEILIGGPRFCRSFSPQLCMAERSIKEMIEIPWRIVLDQTKQIKTMLGDRKVIPFGRSQENKLP